jgi:hypothetical protein
MILSIEKRDTYSNGEYLDNYQGFTGSSFARSWPLVFVVDVGGSNLPLALWKPIRLHSHAPRNIWFVDQIRSPQICSLFVTLGKIVRISPREIDIASVSVAKQIHSFKDPFLKSELYERLKGGNGSHNVFSTRDVDFHSRNRRLLSAPLSESNLKDVEHVVKARADLAVEKIGLEMQKRGAADVLKWWTFFTTDVIGELTFGDSFRMLEQSKVKTFFVGCQI